MIRATDLPPPPTGRTGWPWTVSAPALADTMPDGRPWPRLTIATPSYQHGAFLEETIRSVLLQGYPALEYVILDGGSTDGSAEIIRRYAPWLHHWRSHPDGGLAEAIGEGWACGSGDIVAYINADDVYLPGAFAAAAVELNAATDAPAVCGGELRMDERGLIRSVVRPASGTLDSLLSLNFLPQPAVFIRRSALDAAGGLDTSYALTCDFELWTRIAADRAIRIVPHVLAATREHGQRISATRRPQIAAELQRLRDDIIAGRSVPLTSRQRRLAKSHLTYGVASIHADRFPRRAGRTAGLVLTAILQHPPLALRLVRDVGRRAVRLRGAALEGQQWIGAVESLAVPGRGGSARVRA